MTLVEFKDLAQGLQAILVGLAVVVGGLWAIYRFRALSELDKAKAEVKKLNMALQERGTLNLQLVVGERKNDRYDDPFLHIKLTLNNVGSRTEVVNFDNSLVGIYKVILDDNKAIVADEWKELHLIGSYNALRSLSVSPGETKELAYIAPIESPGSYYIEAILEGSPDEINMQSESQSKVAEIGKLKWGAHTYTVVTDKIV